MPQHHGEETLDYIGNAIGNVTQSIANKLDETIGQTEYAKQWKRGVFNITRGVSAHLEYADEEANYSPQTPTDALYWAVGNFNKSREEAIQNAGEFAANTKFNGKGIDPRLGRFFAGEAVDFLLTAGVGGLAKKVVKGIDNIPPPKSGLIPITSAGQVRLDTKNWINQKGGNVLNLTVENKDLIAKGVEEGISQTGKFKIGLDKWKARREYLLGELKNPNKQSAKAQKVEKSKLANDMSTFNPDNEVLGFWGKGPTAKYLKMAKERGAYPGQQAHHLFPKNESYAFIRRMAEIGDDDDLVNLFLYAEQLDAKMGGHFSNLLHMDPQPHIGKSITVNGKKLEPGLHLQRQADGREFKNKAAEQMAEFVNEAQTADELMYKFDDYLRNNILSSKSDAIRLQKQFEEAAKSAKSDMYEITQGLNESRRRRD